MFRFSSIFFYTALFIMTTMAVSCHSAPSKYELSALEFQKKIEQLDNELIVDVRTSSEFEDGHIKGAVNVDWDGDAFDKQIAKFDKTMPVLIYCLTGKRSYDAARKMRDMGFKVYELDGGIMQWRAAHLPEENGNGRTDNGLSMADYNKELVTDKLVLVDFSAPWCDPCKKMAPYIDELEKERSTTLKVLKINTDENQQLSTDMQIESLPTVLIYKDQHIVWRHVGYANKELLETTINSIK